MLARFSRRVIDSDGRTVEVQPPRQIVLLRVAWVTAGFRVPGVQPGSGLA
jgi:hypothetical protein